MAHSTSPLVLTGAQLRRGYELSIDNALRLAGAAGTLLMEYPDKALALAQLGQEEIGKSLSLLAAGALPRAPESWAWLWDGWRDHQLKAHRAYLYEIFHPLRISIAHPTGSSRYEGGPLLDRLSAEKEVGFYVDYDRALDTFVSPHEVVDEFAAVARISTLTYLCATADAIRRALSHDDYFYRFRTFATIAYRVCSEEVFQQDWPAMRASFVAKSFRHHAIVADIETGFRGMADFFRASVAGEQSAAGAPDADEHIP